MDQMKDQLVELLNIKATSGNEKPVRDYLLPILSILLDTVGVDEHGNILGEKKVGSGEGATILLSAHMDTVKAVLKNSVIVENNGFIMANKGALGADDRAGIAIILAVLRSDLKFDGTIKIVFSVKEEIGCIGSRKIDPNWLENIDLAIVVDRRGNRDIVVGCGVSFCSDSVGYFFEDISGILKMNWKPVEGGSSDAVTFSRRGINSVNLSAGYRNEHTEKEYVIIKDMEDTLRFILKSLELVNQSYKSFDPVPEENRWVRSWQGKHVNEVYAEEFDEDGDVYIFESGKHIMITQNENEIKMSKETLSSLLDQLKE